MVTRVRKPGRQGRPRGTRRPSSTSKSTQPSGRRSSSMPNLPTRFSLSTGCAASTPISGSRKRTGLRCWPWPPAMAPGPCSATTAPGSWPTRFGGDLHRRRRPQAGSSPAMPNYDVHHTRGIVAEDLWLGLQQRMGELEGMIVASHAGCTADSRRRPAVPSSARSRCGRVHQDPARPVPPPEPASDPRAGCGAGDRTPLFLTTTSWSRFSWYLKLPLKDAGPMDGIVRAEVNADQDVASARRIADLTAATMCRYASAAHKDPRAPQNLYPVGQLERKTSSPPRRPRTAVSVAAGAAA